MNDSSRIQTTKKALEFGNDNYRCNKSNLPIYLCILKLSSYNSCSYCECCQQYFICTYFDSLYAIWVKLQYHLVFLDPHKCKQKHILLIPIRIGVLKLRVLLHYHNPHNLRSFSEFELYKWAIRMILFGLALKEYWRSF